MNEREALQGEEFHFGDLLKAIRDGWRWVAASVAIGGVGASGFLALSAPKYEATALVQVAQVSGGAVEPPAQTIERIKSSSFQSKVADALGDVAWQDRLRTDGAKLKAPLSVQALKSSPGLIELKAVGNSVLGAKKIAEATLSALTNKHAELAAPTLTRMKSDLAIVQEKLLKAEAEMESLLKSVATVGARDERFTQLSLIASLQVQKNSEIFSLRQQILHLNEMLGEPATLPTRAIEPVYVPERSVSPGTALVLTLGFLGGGMLGGIALFIRNALKRSS